MKYNQRGSATLHSLFAAVLLLTALTAVTFWSTISTARHKLATAADLTALSAAQSLATSEPPVELASILQPTTVTQSATALRPAAVTPPVVASHPTAVTDPVAGPCATAAHVAALHKVDLTACTVTPTSVIVQVARELDLPFTRPTLTATSRAGPV